jgi:hypothetical protein
VPRDPVIELYGKALEYVWNQPQVPAPQQLADWIESQTWRVDPEWCGEMIQRLRSWPAGENYPLIPDNDALLQRSIKGKEETDRWWEPGAIRHDAATLPLSRRARRQANIRP